MPNYPITIAQVLGQKNSAKASGDCYLFLNSKINMLPVKFFKTKQIKTAQDIGNEIGSPSPQRLIYSQNCTDLTKNDFIPS